MATLETIYKNQLGRAPDAGGLAHYQAQIAGGRSIDDIRQEIASSPEAQSRGVGAYASGGGGGSSSQSQAAAPKYTQILSNRGGTGLAGSDTLPTGRGQHSFYASLGAATKKRGDLFSGSIKDRNLSLLEGYSFTGGQGKTLVDTISYRGNDTNPDGTINIYKEAAPAQTTTTDTDTTDTTDTNTGTSNVATNPYQGQIDELTSTLGTISGQIGGYTETINSLRGQMETMQTNFGKQLETIMAANSKALEDMNTQYQTQLAQQQEAAERARQQRELAAQTAAANQARAGQQAEFQLGSGMMRGIFGGLAGFKRRGKVKASTSDALSIGATTEKSPNKMLNV